MKQVQLIDNFSKITISNNNSINKSISKEVAKNIDENLKNIKNMKRLFLISPKISFKNDSNQTDNILNIKPLNKKILKNFSSTTNKFYHSSLSCLSYSNVNNERKKINRDSNNINKEKIIVLKFKTKKKEENNNMRSLNAIRIQNLFKEKNVKKIKKSFSNNDLNYNKYINKKIRFSHLRNNKRKNISYISSNAISNDLINNYENIMMNQNLNVKEKKLDDNHLKKKITKDKNKLKYYSFNDIINSLTRNINIVNTSTSKELHLKLLRKIDELVKFPSISNIKSEENLENEKNNKTFLSSNNNNLTKKLEKIEKIDLEKEKYFLSENNIIKEFLEQTNSKNNSVEKIDSKKKLILNDDEEIDKNDLIEDLKFLGNTNKLNWNLISEDDKKKGEETWKKLINAKKDVGINCQINKEDFKNTIKKIPNIKTPKASIKHIVFMSEERKSNDNSRQAYTLRPRKKFEPIKFNNSSTNKVNSNLKMGTKNNLNSNNKSNNNIDQLKSNQSEKQKHILSEKKIKPRYNYIKTNYKIINKLNKNDINNNNNDNKPGNINPHKNIEDIILEYDSNLDIISEEIKSNKINSINKDEGSYNEKNEEYEEYKSDNKEILNELKFNLKINEPIFNKKIAEKIIQNNKIKEKLISENNKEQTENLEENIKIEENNKEQEEEKKDDIDNNQNDNKEKEEKEIKEKEEDTINKKQDEEDEDDLEERRRRYEKSKLLYQSEKFNRELLLKKLRMGKINPKKKRLSIYELIKESSKNKDSSNMSYLNNIKKRKYFTNIKSISDINKRKMEILLKLKHDLEYKLISGLIKSIEKFNFKEFVNKINSTTIETLDEKSVNEYIDKLEEYFNSFENDINNFENMRKNEERINAFKNKLIYNMENSEKIRENKSKIYGNVIDFNNINHINELSLYDKNNKENIKRNNT